MYNILPFLYELGVANKKSKTVCRNFLIKWVLCMKVAWL